RPEKRDHEPSPSNAAVGQAVGMVARRGGVRTDPLRRMRASAKRPREVLARRQHAHGDDGRSHDGGARADAVSGEARRHADLSRSVLRHVESDARRGQSTPPPTHPARERGLPGGRGRRPPPAPPAGVTVSPRDGISGNTFTFTVTGAKVGEAVTFQIMGPAGRVFTGSPHTASNNGVVTATYISK